MKPDRPISEPDGETGCPANRYRHTSANADIVISHHVTNRPGPAKRLSAITWSYIEK